MPAALLGVLLGAVSLVLVVALVLLLLGDHEIRQLRAEGRQQDRLARAELDEARTAYHRAQTERDLARETVRDLLSPQGGLRWRWPTGMPMPMPPDLDDAPTDEFTQITGRHTWPQWPEQPS